MKDLYTVKEFSLLTGVEMSKLRFYDKIGLFSPAIRNPENNYRYYSPAQVISLNFINVLSDLHLPLKTIAELRKKRSPVDILKILDDKDKELSMEMRDLQQRHTIINVRRELINYGILVENGFMSVNGKRVSDDNNPEGAIKVDESTISVLHRERQEYILWPRNEYEKEDTFIQPLASLITQVAENNISFDFPIGGYYDSMESFTNNPSQPEHFFTIDPFGKDVRKEGKYLVGFHRGYYGEMGDLPKRMNAYVAENALTLSGPVMVMYMFDELCEVEHSDFLVQAVVAVSSAKHRRS